MFDSFLLKEELRDKWKFQGYVTSDCDSVAELYSGHHAETPAEAAALALERGMDLDCIFRNDYSHILRQSGRDWLPNGSAILPSSACSVRASFWACSIRRAS